MRASKHLSEPPETLPEGRSRLNRVPKQEVCCVKRDCFYLLGNANEPLKSRVLEVAVTLFFKITKYTGVN